MPSDAPDLAVVGEVIDLPLGDRFPAASSGREVSCWRQNDLDGRSLFSNLEAEMEHSVSKADGGRFFAIEYAVKSAWHGAASPFATPELDECCKRISLPQDLFANNFNRLTREATPVLALADAVAPVSATPSATALE